MIYLPDADTLNYLVKGILAVRMRFRAEVAAGATFVLSPVVHYQLTRYLKLKRATRILRFYDRLTSQWLWEELVGSDWDRAADLWEVLHRQGLSIHDSDLLIAVTALKTGATLVTNNTRHFAGLGLSLENWA